MIVYISGGKQADVEGLKNLLLEHEFKVYTTNQELRNTLIKRRIGQADVLIMMDDSSMTIWEATIAKECMQIPVVKYRMTARMADEDLETYTVTGRIWDRAFFRIAEVVNWIIENIVEPEEAITENDMKEAGKFILQFSRV